MVPTGVYIPQMVQNGLLEAARHEQAPQLRQHRPAVHEPDLGPGNKYSACEGLGLDRLDLRHHRHHDAASRPGSDFIDAADGPGQRQHVRARRRPATSPASTSGPTASTGTPTTTADLDHAEDFLVDQFAPHIKAFDSYPGITLTQGNYALSQVWNGDARRVLAVEDAGDDPAKYKWGLGAPKTELWMDNWGIVKGATNLDAAYDFINYILDPANSAKELEYHGYNTAREGHRGAAAADLQYPEMIFFTPSR